MAAAVRPVTTAMLRGHASERTLREAAALLVERYFGEIRVEGGQAVIAAPPISRDDWVSRELRELIELLVEAAPAIVAAAGKTKSGVVAPERLPDKLVCPGGVLVERQ